MFRVFALAVLALLAPLEGGGVMFAAKQIFLGRSAKAVPTAKSYVQDGLVGLYDTVENVAFGVSDHSDRRIVNLVGNDPLKDFSLSEGTVFGENYMTNPSYCPFARNSWNKAWRDYPYIEVVFTPTSYSSEAFIFGAGYAYSAGVSHVMVVYKANGAILQPTQYSDDAEYAIFDQSPVLGTRYTLGFSCSNNTGPMVSAYCNGEPVQVQTGSKTGLYAYTTSGVWGGQSNSARPTLGWLMHGVRMYSRVPTAAEIAANYAVDKERFKLP